MTHAILVWLSGNTLFALLPAAAAFLAARRRRPALAHALWLLVLLKLLTPPLLPATLHLPRLALAPRPHAAPIVSTTAAPIAASADVTPERIPDAAPALDTPWARGP